MNHESEYSQRAIVINNISEQIYLVLLLLNTSVEREQYVDGQLML